MTGTRMTHVPYKGAAPMLTDLVAGTIQVGFDNLPSSMGMIQSGDVRALAVTTPERWPGTPDLPTVAESGVPEYEVSGWFGLLAPAGTPAAIVERIQAAVAEAVRKPGVQEQFAAAGAKPVADRPDVFARQIAADVERWKKVVETTGVRLE
ncbi:Bug family tripartite tricarboxylate transporter substrate binding protein [Pseudoroseomonas wenyumeiae]